MDNYKIVTLADAVEGGFMKVDKFKSSLLTFSFFVPLDGRAGAFTVLSKLLTDGNAEFPTMRGLKKRLFDLYNAALSCETAKTGDMLRIGFEMNFINDEYALNGEKISVAAAELLITSLFNPAVTDGKFNADDIERERRITIDAVKSEINNKRRYALNNALKIMCAGEPVSLPQSGTVEQLTALTNDDLIQAHNYLLHNAFVRVNFVGNEYPEELFALVADKFSQLDRSTAEKKLICKPHILSSVIKKQTDEIDINQSKLFLGFSFDSDDDFTAETVAKFFILLYSGGTYSKCFRYVREKLSLCYYCAPTLVFNKRMFFVDCGIDAENYEKAVNAILEQLESIQQGDISDEDFNSAMLTSLSGLKEFYDSQDMIDNFLVSNIFKEEKYNDIDVREKVISGVTKQQVIDFAKTVKPDTVYMLKSNAEGDRADG